jgi:AAA15 family ATPase/GTPase
MGNIHIKSLHINSFRGLKNLELENFTGVNIFTGENNSGKTSVLEVMQLLTDPAGPDLLSEISRRGKDNQPSLSVYIGIKDLFDTNQDTLNISYSFILAGNKISYDVKISASEDKQKILWKDVCAIQGTTCQPGSEFNETTIEQMHLNFKFNSYTDDTQITSIDRFGNFVQNLDKPYLKDMVKPVIYISPVEHAENKLFLSDILDNPQLYEEMLDVLKNFDDTILSINADGKNEYTSIPSRIVYKILSKKNNNALPLNVYGDGMKKAVLIMSSVLAAKNGVLLIDEFETAIHTSAMNDVFKWILTTCKKLNVQIFLTTHSKEALQKLIALDSELPDEITLYTLYKKENKTSVRRLSAKDAIEADAELGVELR